MSSPFFDDCAAGPLRVFALQFAPAIIHAYLTGLSLNEHTKCMHLQTFLLAVYNHEIVDHSTAGKRPASPADSLLTAPRQPRVVRVSLATGDDDAEKQANGQIWHAT